MKILLLIAFLIFTDIVFGQNNYSQYNAWLSFNGQFNSKKYRVVLDGGHRTFNHFLINNRTSLIRASFGLRVFPELYMGGGVALFKHYTYPADEVVALSEFRPFIQVNYFKNLTTAQLRFRFRNEIRCWNDFDDIKNRSRIMVSYLPVNKGFVKLPVLQYEFFITPESKVLFENRLMIGAQLDLSKQVDVLVYYMAQYQSNMQYLQNIMGLTLQYTLQHGA